MSENIQPSEKLGCFLEYIEKESRRPIRLEITSTFEIPGMVACIIEHPTHIYIKLKDGLQINDEKIEATIAHEATHGLLFYGRNFARARFKDKQSAQEGKHLTILFNVIDDLAVSKILQENEFALYDELYIQQTKKDIKRIRKQKGIYQEFSHEKLFKEFFIIARYVLAWGTIKYFKPDFMTRKLLKRFLKTVEKYYPNECSKITDMITLLNQYNIFGVLGNRAVKEQIIKKWDNKKLVILTPTELV